MQLTPKHVTQFSSVRGDVLRHINLLGNVDLVIKGGTIYRQNGQVVESAL